jgi:hypothetical protein
MAVNYISGFSDAALPKTVFLPRRLPPSWSAQPLVHESTTGYRRNRKLVKSLKERHEI